VDTNGIREQKTNPDHVRTQNADQYIGTEQKRQDKMIAKKECTQCGVIKPLSKFYFHKQRNQYWSECKSCKSIRQSELKHGIKRSNKNKYCPDYLGCCVAETLLSNVFSTVIKTPRGNIGYDFICGKGFKIDVKSSCRDKNNRWKFNIHKNKIADYFCCLAFDNRKSITPIHFWIIPGIELNDIICTTISKSTIKRWSDYEKPISKIISCCNTLKDRKPQ
jgi:hypothetical protein